MTVNSEFLDSVLSGESRVPCMPELCPVSEDSLSRMTAGGGDVWVLRERYVSVMRLDPRVREPSVECAVVDRAGSMGWRSWSPRGVA